MTKVTQGLRKALSLLALALSCSLPAAGQSAPAVAAAPAAPANSAELLYLQLRTVGLDKSRVFHARDVSFSRDAVRIALDDGIIAFTEDVEGRVTGAFFQGEGEILLMPPNQLERQSMLLFTGAAILEEKFTAAYFRFNDDTYAELKPQLRPAEGGEVLTAQWNQTARNLASVDGLRLLMSFCRFLPVAGQALPPNLTDTANVEGDHFFRAHIEGQKLGTFDVTYDSTAFEPVRAGQLRTDHGETFYDTWTSFSSKSVSSSEAGNANTDEDVADASNIINVSSYKIRAEVTPPTQLECDATLQIDVQHGGRRALLFELSRFLEIKKLQADGRPIEFIQNPALEGTRLARRGNDLVIVVFPRPLRAGEHVQLHFEYRGEVLSDAGGGLLYVGARGTWYPNRGLARSNFDLEFHYPAGWTLVATGTRRDPEADPGANPAGQVARWVSERAMPFAGFNLGKYTRAVAHAGNVEVEAYATSGVEREFPQATATIVNPAPGLVQLPRNSRLIEPPLAPSPAGNDQLVADESARAVDFFAQRFGPYPYSKLALTQMPGKVSQGWPGLIFLSSYAFLNTEQKNELHMNPLEIIRTGALSAHETAHQWWGDLVGWRSYHDQWIVEALSEYCSMMLLESRDAAKFRAVMDSYRENLLAKNKDGAPLAEAGPVTLGVRLSSSHFPEGYEAISYGRGTWLFHMLRSMMRDAALKDGASERNADEPFNRALRKLREQYEGKSVSTASLLRVFEEELPPSLWYEHHRSLEWFYQGWVNGTAVPRLEIQALKYSDGPGATKISGTIVQKDAPDDLVTSVPVYGTVAGKSVLLGRVFADGTVTAFRLSAPAGARKVVLDPERTVLAQSR